MSGAEREAQIRRFLPLVRSIARRIHRLVPNAELDDLISEGCVGLLRAVDAFDPERGVSFYHFARKVIMGAVLNGVRRNDPVNERLRRTVRNADRLRYALAQQLGTLPTHAEMEAHDPKLARARIEAHRRAALSLDSPLPHGERVALDRAGDPQNVVALRLERQRVHRAIAALPPRERRVVVMRYFAETRLRDLAEPMHISPQRVSQLHLRAMRHLRETLKQSA
ncbi:MAG: sigma-70 family RNA polymerase sigma factor [Candidatus Eremiobacteraeota bacterium]|nr:sigma-70 family RNA polymerase sigma factor [Candidatus Eremiobacteraeota bacterium]